MQVAEVRLLEVRELLSATTPEAGSEPMVNQSANVEDGAPRSSGTEMRTYKIAIATTGEFTARIGGVSKTSDFIDDALAKVNHIFEKELSIHLELIANNDALISTNAASDGYTNSKSTLLGPENQVKFDNLGAGFVYDVGHVLAYDSLIPGGSSKNASMGGLTTRAMGATVISDDLILSNGISDLFIVNYFAHEIAHQFGAHHTFSAPDGLVEADTNFDKEAAVEPGSGSTMMGYPHNVLFAGSPDKLQDSSDPYFSWKSFDEIIKYVDDVRYDRGSRTATGNNIPLINAGLDYTIPANTSFRLSPAGASDDDGVDSLTYTWEQSDITSTTITLAQGDVGSGPLLRSVKPSSISTRTFLGSQTPNGEKLPTTTRQLNFRATVRDNFGGVNSDDMRVNVIDTGDPFQLFTGNGPGAWDGGSMQTIEWDVAGTDAGAINVDTVTIKLSRDGGQTFDITLAEGVPNTGSAEVQIPNLQSSQVRLMIEADGNIFFDISNTNASINLTDNHAPDAPGPQIFEINENSPVGTVIGTVEASDIDFGQTLTYEAVTVLGNSGYFEVDRDTGEIRLIDNTALNFETQEHPFVYMVVNIIDDGSPRLSTVRSITIHLRDVNEAPRMELGTGTVVAPDLFPFDVGVGQINVYDEDHVDGNNVLSITGDTDVLDLVDGTIMIKAGSDLRERAGARLTVTVKVDDESVGDSPDEEKTFTLYVADGFDQSPTFNTPVPFLMDEHSPEGTIAGQIIVHGADTLIITGGNQDDAFEIDSEFNLVVANAEAVDYEGVGYFDLTLTATREASVGSLDTEFIHRVYLNNINESAPVAGPHVFDLERNTRFESYVGTVVAIDPDKRDSVYYSIVGEGGGAFQINSLSGELTVEVFDFVNLSPTKEYNFMVQVVDRELPPEKSVLVPVKIRMIDTNLHAPTVTPRDFLISENSLNNAFIGNISANDSDSGQTLTYAITAGNTNNAFAINSSTGALRVNNSAALNYEAITQFNLTVTATDNGIPSKSGSAPVRVFLRDVNEFSPVVTPKQFLINENSANNAFIGTIVASDGDTAQTRTFSVTGGNTNNAFKIDPVSGVFSVNNTTALNFETNPRFDLTIQVTDSGNPVRSGTATVTVFLRDVNEFNPVVLPKDFLIGENSANNAFIGTIVAADADTAQTRTFTISAGNTNNAFKIDPVSGELRVNNSAALNYESVQQFNLTVTVIDSGTPSKAGSAAVRVFLKDVNEFNPVVKPKDFLLNENTANNAFMGTITATDQDTAQTRTFAITAGNTNNAFKIDPVTGELRVNNSAALNFETTPQFNLMVTATDNGNPAKTGSAAVNVFLRDVNEAPVVTPRQFLIGENSANNAFIGNIPANDPDAGQTRTFAITAGNTSNAFAIDPVTGALRVNNSAALNFESIQKFDLTITVTDNGNPAKAGSALVTVFLKDVNESPVVTPKQFLINENTANNAFIGTIVATDPDAGQTRTFAITAGNTNNAFKIEAGTGILRVNNSAALNFESTPQFNLTVTVTDNGNPAKSGSATVTVFLRDVVGARETAMTEAETTTVVVPSVRRTAVNPLARLLRKSR